MKKTFLAILLVIVIGGYIFYNNNNSNATYTAPIATPQTTPVTKSTSVYKDGSYTGPVTDAYYGNVQVKAIVTGGKLTDVIFLQFPKDRAHSLQLSQDSMVALKTEAITAQSANVDIISGATQTSLGFQQSLAAALTDAKI